MMEAVDQIGREILELGKRMDSSRLSAFALMTLGEIASQNYLDDPFKSDQGIQQLLEANELY